MVARPFNTDPTLTAIAIGYRNRQQDLIADDVMPRVPVMGEEYKWIEYPLAELFTVPRTLVGRRGRVERVEFTGEDRTGRVLDYGLEVGVPVSDTRAAASMRTRGLGIFDPLNHSAEALTNLILLDREVRVAAKVQDPANYGAGRRLVLSGSAQFSDYEGSSPIDVLKDAFAGTLIFPPNVMSMGRPVWRKLSSHPHIVNAIKGNVTGRGIVTRDEFVELFAGEGLKKLCIGEGFVNTSKPGQPAQINQARGKSIQLHYTDPTMRPETGGMTWGFSAQLGTRISGSWEDRNVGLEGGTVVRVGEHIEEQVVAKDVGFIIQNVVA